MPTIVHKRLQIDKSKFFQALSEVGDTDSGVQLESWRESRKKLIMSLSMSEFNTLKFSAWEYFIREEFYIDHEEYVRSYWS